MLRNRLDKKLSDFARSLSPTEGERAFISEIYDAIRESLSEYDCCQIGSYPRFTAIKPVHDLDILCCIGKWVGPNDPKNTLLEIVTRLRADDVLRKRLPNVKEMRAGEHSIGIEFEDSDLPSVDIVPCYEDGSLNEFGDHLYRVPQIMRLSRDERKEAKWDAEMDDGWVLSDPKGYIKIAKGLNDRGDYFRKVVKLVKFWKRDLREKTSIKLKSFHLEQIVVAKFYESEDLVQLLVGSFRSIPQAISHSGQIRDRAEQGRYIDDYVDGFSDKERETIQKSIKNLLLKLEQFGEDGDVAAVFRCDLSDISPDEQLITYDYGFIPCWDDECDLAEIYCDNHPNRSMRAKIDDEALYFKLRNAKRKGFRYYFKVSNSHKAVPIEEWRGEITESGTKYDPERKKYAGLHRVECYAVNEKKECVSYYCYWVRLE